ncbi:hypothetical protein JGI14_10582 [Candidatus Kryptonium thompsonii]|nr:hypothetical protein JGI14_10582 [Candidatus Kryptonium thompsoni]
MEITTENKYTPAVDLQNVMLAFALFTPLIGMFVNYYAMWVVMFMFGLIQAKKQTLV